MLNCKEGDLAIIVKSLAGNEGKIVKCVRFLGTLPDFSGGNRWLIDRAINGINKNKTVFAIRHHPDAWMRPINDTDAEDEMIRIAGKPKVLETEDVL